MDRKAMERYLIMYPEMDAEIEKLEEELNYYQSQKNKIISMNLPKEHTDSILEKINYGYLSCANELQEIIEAKTKIGIALNDMTATQREIIEYRFWETKGRPTPWDDVAYELCFHRVHIMRLYKDALNKMVS